MRPQVFIPNTFCTVRGFVVPYDQIRDTSLKQLEGILGFAAGRFDKGVAFAQLQSLPLPEEIEYFGDTRAAAHHFDALRNKNMTHDQLSQSAYHFFTPSTRLIKVLPLKNENPMEDPDLSWPSGHGAMQFRLKVPKPAMVIRLVEDYPNGRFS